MSDDRVWRDDAACRGRDKNFWFPDVGRVDDVKRAKAICDGCSVRTECLNWALKHEDHGIWGATTPDERVTIRRKRQRAARARARASQL